MSGFRVNLAALALTAEGVRDVLGQLGIDGQQTSGSPVTALALSQDDSGDELVSLVLEQLLDRAHMCCAICCATPNRWRNGYRPTGRTTSRSKTALPGSSPPWARR